MLRSMPIPPVVARAQHALIFAVTPVLPVVPLRAGMMPPPYLLTLPTPLRESESYLADEGPQGNELLELDELCRRRRLVLLYIRGSFLSLGVDHITTTNRKHIDLHHH
ncbi:unnamed protein product, partial [Laminaria digitata]